MTTNPPHGHGPVTGSFNGSPISVSFSPTDPVLTWSTPHDQTEAHQVSSDQIVGVLGSGSSAEQQSYRLLYVDSPAVDAQDEAADQCLLHTLALASVPPRLLQQYSLHHSTSFLHTLLAQPTQQRPVLHVLVSTGSGHRHAAKAYANLVQPLLAALGLTTYTLHETSSPDTITELTAATFRPAAEAGTRQLLLLLSGDGGVVDLLNALLDARPPASLPPTYARPLIALLPLGTGNALAHSSGTTRDRTLGLSTLLRGAPAPLPIFAVRFDPPATSASTPTNAPTAVAHTSGAVVFSWALHAALVADSDTPTYRALGAARFQAAAKENLFPPAGTAPHAYAGVVAVRRAGGDEWTTLPERTHSYVLATLCARLERTFTVSPQSGPLDGALWLVHIGAGTEADPMTGERMIARMSGGYSGGKHVEEADVRYEAVDGVRVVVDETDADEGVEGGRDRWRRVCVDGKIFAVPRGGIVEVDAQTGATALDILHLA